LHNTLIRQPTVTGQQSWQAWIVKNATLHVFHDVKVQAQYGIVVTISIDARNGNNVVAVVVVVVVVVVVGVIVGIVVMGQGSQNVKLAMQGVGTSVDNLGCLLAQD